MISDTYDELENVPVPPEFYKLTEKLMISPEDRSRQSLEYKRKFLNKQKIKESNMSKKGKKQ